MALPDALVPTNPKVPVLSAIGLWITPSNYSLDIEIQRAPDVTGSPGTFVQIRVLPGGTFLKNNRFYDMGPQLGEIYWYRIRHIGPAVNNSAWLGPVQGTAQLLSDLQAAPDPALPTLQLTVTPSTVDYSIAYTTTAPVVEHSIDGGAWAASTSPIVIPRNPHGGGDKVVSVRATAVGGTTTDTVAVPEVSATQAPSEYPRILNGDFESGGSTPAAADSGWEIITDTTAVYDTSTEIDGARSLELTIRSGSVDRIKNRGRWAVRPGEWYGVQLTMRVSSGSIVNSGGRIVWVDSAGADLSATAIVTPGTSNGTWTIGGIAPAGAVQAYFEFYSTASAGANGTLFADKIVPLVPINDLTPIAGLPKIPTIPAPGSTGGGVTGFSPKGFTPVATGEVGLNMLLDGDFTLGDLEETWDETAYGPKYGIPELRGFCKASIVAEPDARSGSYVYQTTEITGFGVSKQHMPIDPYRQYRESAWARRTASTAASPLYIGLAPFDKDGVHIQPWHWRNGGSEERTQVNGALSGGETTITVDDGSKFGAEGSLSNSYIAFNADSTAGQYSDLPNFDTYKLASRSGNVLTIDTSFHPGGFPAIADNAWVRKHVSGASFIYLATKGSLDLNAETVDEWQYVSGEIGPSDPSSPVYPFSDPDGTLASSTFPAGTATVRATIMTNWSGAANATIQVDRLRFEKMLEPGEASGLDGSRLGSDGGNANLPPGTRVGDGAGNLPTVKGMQFRTLEHNDAITFVPAFQNTPDWAVVKGAEGFHDRPDSVWGTRAQCDADSGNTNAAPSSSNRRWPIVGIDGLSPTGGTLVALIAEDTVSLTPESQAFVAGVISTIGGSKTCDIGTATPAYLDLFTYLFDVDITSVVASTKTPDWQTTEIDIDLEYNDGVSGWQTIASKTYSETAEGLGTSSSVGWSEALEYAISGIDDNEDFRITVTDIRKTGNLGSGIVAEVDPTSMDFDSFSSDPDNYARKTSASRKITIAFWDANA